MPGQSGEKLRSPSPGYGHETTTTPDHPPRPASQKLPLAAPDDKVYADPATIYPEQGTWMNARTVNARERLKKALAARQNLLEDIPVNSLKALHHKVSREDTGGWVKNAHDLAFNGEEYDKNRDAFSEFDPGREDEKVSPESRVKGKQSAVRNLLSNVEFGPENPLHDGGSRFDPNTEPAIQPDAESGKPRLKRQLTPRSRYWQEAREHGDQGNKAKRQWDYHRQKAAKSRQQASDAGEQDEAATHLATAAEHEEAASAARTAAHSAYQKAVAAIKEAEAAHGELVAGQFELADERILTGAQTMSIPRTEQWQKMVADLEPEEREGKGGNIFETSDGAIKLRLPNGNTVPVASKKAAGDTKDAASWRGKVNVEQGEELGYYRKGSDPDKDETERIRRVNEDITRREERARQRDDEASRKTKEGQADIWKKINDLPPEERAAAIKKQQEKRKQDKKEKK